MINIKLASYMNSFSCVWANYLDYTAGGIGCGNREPYIAGGNIQPPVKFGMSDLNLPPLAALLAGIDEVAAEGRESPQAHSMPRGTAIRRKLFESPGMGVILKCGDIILR